MKDDLVYLDHAATTPVDPRVFEAMAPWFTERFANAASRQHAPGRAAAEAVEEARAAVARAFGADPREIVFTSGATESNNLVLKGVPTSDAYARRPGRIVTCATEHHAVLDPLRTLAEERGFEVVRLGVDADGALDLDRVADELARGARLVSLMHANNETGVLHPIAEIGRLCRAHGVPFHTDAAQSAGKEPLDVEALHVDALSLSAHKLYGPKGAGALYLRRRRPRVRCRPLLDGGGHERGLRSGTANVPGIVGLAAALTLAVAGREEEHERVSALRERLERGLMDRLEGVARNGAEPRLAGTTNLAFEGIEAEALLARLDTVAASSSAACTSAALQPSHVLRALGASEARIAASVRFSLGRWTTAAEVDRAVEDVAGAVERERRRRG